MRALVTGGSGDIGGAICHELARAGHEVLVHANGNVERAQALAQAITDNGGHARALAFDVTDAEACGEALEAVLAAGPIQILVHNAGIHDDAPLAGMSIERWHQVIDVSLHGFYNVCHPLLLPMIRTRWGRIVGVSSISGEHGNRGQANYAAAKAGLAGALKSLAVEVASRGVTANIVAPGLIDTGMSNAVFSPEQIREHIPMNRAGTPVEVAAVVGFLCSEQASYVTRQVISVNGGMI